METKLSTKGQVVVPEAIRRKLGLRGGEVLSVELRGNTISLTLRRPTRRKPRIAVSEASGLPVIDLGDDAPMLTSKQVRAALADFP